MKTYIKDFTVGMQIKSHFFVVDRRLINYTRSGSPACGLVLTLGDRTGKVTGVSWHESLVKDASYRKDDVVLVCGKVQDYKGEKQIFLEEVTKANFCLLYTSPSPRDS